MVPLFQGKFDFSFEDEVLDKKGLQRHFWDEIYKYRPHLRKD